MSHFLYRGKRIFYQEYGQGAPMIFLHGNTASSKMFELLMPLYAESFRCILMDFLGNGRSDRVEEFPPDVWYDEALQAISLAEHLRCGRAFLVGTSGGAWAAVNGALERPDLFRAVIADSFDGRALHEDFAHCLKVERAAAKADPQARQFYEWCQGDDWEMVVDLDTEALVNYEKKHVRIFRAPIETIQVPLMITVSREDEMLANDMEAECRRLHEANPDISYHVFDTGGHPLIATRAEEIAGIVKEFLCDD